MTVPLVALGVPVQSFADAVERAGGRVVPLAEADSLVWSAGTPAELRAVLRAHPGVRWVQLGAAGVDGYHDDGVLAAGPVFTSAKGAYARPVAEHALALTLACLRELPRRAKAATWETQSGRMLYGSEVLIVGGGGIAREFARLIEPFGCRITVVRRSSEPFPGAARTIGIDGLVDAAAETDVLVVAAALTEQTRGLVGDEVLRRLRPHSVLVNVARGAIVDTQALVRELRAGTFAAAGLDVTEPEPLPDGHPLWALPNVLVTPHTADTPDMIEALLAVRIEQNVRALAAGEPLTGVVDARLGY